MIAHTAAQHVATVAGFVRTFREIVNAMDAERDRSDKIEPGEVGGWITQFDLIGNALSSANDELIGLLRECAIETVLPDGCSLHRQVPI